MEGIEYFLRQTERNVEALDYSAIGIQTLDKITKEKRLPMKPQFFDVRKPLHSR
jgi:hypothetical protein